MSRRSRDNRVPFTRVPPTAPLRRSARCRLSIHDEENRPTAMPTQPNLRQCKRCRAPNANVGDYCIECIATSVSVDAATGFLPHSPVSTLPHLGIIAEETAVERLEKEIGQLKREKEQLAEELRQKNEELSSSMAINSMLMSYFNVQNFQCACIYTKHKQ